MSKSSWDNIDSVPKNKWEQYENYNAEVSSPTCRIHPTQSMAWNKEGPNSARINLPVNSITYCATVRKANRIRSKCG